jgi:hypothetical protein
LHPELGLPSCERECDIPSLRQVLAFVEAEVERRPVERLAIGGIEDPVLALITERAGLWAECELTVDEPGDQAFDARVDQTSEVTRALDERMVDMVAASPAGLIAQVELLAAEGKREQSARVGEPVDDDLIDRLAASIVDGIKALVAPSDEPDEQP